VGKVEKILKSSLDAIPSPSVKIQIVGGKSCLRCKWQNIVGHCQQTFENKKFVDITQQCFALLPQVNFSMKVKVMGSNPGYLLKSFLL
jgi:hypothetical protein